MLGATMVQIWQLWLDTKLAAFDNVSTKANVELKIQLKPEL
jgi:hypothetical protein